jgi:MerR family redox-sensitive transcriptional activator SoxR
MPQLTISEVGRQVRLQPSAIRYYERIGLLSPVQRMSGQRRYDTAVLYRLAIIQRARQFGFTLEEIRQLFFAFSNVTPVSKRWQKLSQRKIAELDALVNEIRTMQRLLRKMTEVCRCETLEQCGRGIFRSGVHRVARKALAGGHRRALWYNPLGVRDASGPRKG